MSRILKSNDTVITQKFKGIGKHNGIDVVGAGHTVCPVLAHSAGTVEMIQTGRGNDQNAKGDASYGNFVKIKHANGYSTLYAHLEKVYVTKGQTVAMGQEIGYMGNTGHSFGAHLHFEVRTNGSYASLTNPEPYVNADLPGLNTDTSKVKYRTHIENDGWTSYVKDGETSGTTGQGKRLEALQIDSELEISAKAHIENIGWKDYGVINKNTVIGTTGEGKRLEDLCLKGNIQYRVHIEDHGWTNWTKADGVATLGSVGLGKRIEAIEIKEA